MPITESDIEKIALLAIWIFEDERKCLPQISEIVTYVEQPTLPTPAR
jgi:Asp-tRNA(Asn)/Glu-tRNA(Gln) amidotransferase C subunit